VRYIQVPLGDNEDTMVFHKIFRRFFPEHHPIQVRKKYGIPDKIDFQVTRKPSGWFVITSPDLPGLVSQCKRLDELMDVYNDAVLTYFDVPKRESDYVFNELNLHGVGQLKLKGNKKVRYA